MKNYYLILIVVAFFFACAGQHEFKLDKKVEELKQSAAKEDSIKATSGPSLDKMQSEISKFLEEKEVSKEQPTVSNLFVETDIRAALMDIATQTKTNIIPDETIEGSVTLELENVPLEKALEMILFPNGYTFKKKDDHYLVGSAHPESPTFGELSVQKTVVTNMPAEIVSAQLSHYFEPYVKVNKLANTITISGPPEIVKRAEAYVKEADKPRQQIEITAIITDIQWLKGKNIGVDWGDLTVNTTPEKMLGKRGTAYKGREYDYSTNVVGSIMSKVQSMGRKAEIDVKAAPKVITLNGETADISLTQIEYILILSGGGYMYSYYTSQQIETGVKLKVTPSIAENDEITLIIQPEVSDVVGEKNYQIGDMKQTLPIINKRTESTIVKVKDGKTITIGGLYMQSKNKTQNYGILPIPIFGELLSRIPVLNFLIRHDVDLMQDSELVIFITPRILKGDESIQSSKN